MSESVALVTRTAVVLTDDELVLLNGSCSEKVQAQVDAAMSRISARDAYPDLASVYAGFIADVLHEALTNGELRWSAERLRSCALCGRRGDYYKFKSGMRKGQPDYKRPLTFPGRSLAYRFVTMQGQADVGGCEDCLVPLLPRLREALRGVAVQVPDVLRAEGEPKRVKHKNRRCTKCGWVGHEGQMGRQRTMMGDGSYPASCPDCGAGAKLFSRDIEVAEGFVVVTAERALSGGNDP